MEIVGGSSRIPSVKTLIEKLAIPLYIYSVEIVGGSSRIPSVKTLIEKVPYSTFFR
jgi:molecular chaperone DnaK (HSP70)